MTKPTLAKEFDITEIAVVLSHYDIGIVHGVEPLNRGSPSAPKLLLHASAGDFLLKRRSPGKDDPHSVAFTHGIQLHLAERQFPLPHLIGTRDQNDSMVRHNGAVYELFEYRPGSAFDFSTAAVIQSGQTLALFHKLLLDHQPQIKDIPTGSYYDHPSIIPAFNKVKSHLARDHHADAAEHAAALEHYAKIHTAYMAAVAKLVALGLPGWPESLVHGDYHPGNCLYTGTHVTAVLDFDSCRKQQNIIDTANGALQFSIRLSKGDPRTWKVNLHVERLLAFIAGYEQIKLLSTAELEAIPSLMICSLVCEVFLGLAAKTQVRGYGAIPWLAMVAGKMDWLTSHEAALIRTIKTSQQ